MFLTLNHQKPDVKYLAAFNTTELGKLMIRCFKILSGMIESKIAH